MTAENWSLVLETCQLKASFDSQFEKLWNLYQEALEIHKFTALKTRDDFAVKHFIDALLPFVQHFPLKPKMRVLDVGTGAGFPGIMLALVYPDTQFVLLDALQKRVTILENIIDAMGLKNVRCIHGRAEDFAHDHEYREQFDVVVARALAPWPLLLELCTPFVQIGGHFVAYQGPAIVEILKQSADLYNELFVKESDVFHYSLPHHVGDRVAVYLEKIEASPVQYPRSAKKMKKYPLIT